jgi:hypothetical protein
MGMRKVTTSHVFECDPTTFWEIFLDDDYRRRLFLEGLGFRDYAAISKSGDSRVIKVTPKMNLPAAVEKIIGGTFAYEEHGTLDREKNVWTWRMVPQTMKDKLFTQGTIRVEAAGEGRCRRTDEVSIEAKIFGLGGLIESTAEKETRSASEKDQAFLTRFIADKKSK